MGGDEKLATVGSRARVGHTQQPGLIVFEGEILILKLVAVDRSGTGTVRVDVVSALTHEVLDDAMEDGRFVPFGDVIRSEFSGAELSKVFAGTWHDVGKEFEFESSGRLISDRDVHEDNGSSVRTCPRNSCSIRGGGRGWIVGIRHATLSYCCVSERAEGLCAWRNRGANDLETSCDLVEVGEIVGMCWSVFARKDCGGSKRRKTENPVRLIALDLPDVGEIHFLGCEIVRLKFRSDFGPIETVLSVPATSHNGT